MINEQLTPSEEITVENTSPLDLDSVDMESYQQALMEIIKISRALTNVGVTVMERIEKHVRNQAVGAPRLITKAGNRIIDGNDRLTQEGNDTIGAIYQKAYPIKDAIFNACELSDYPSGNIPVLQSLITLIARAKRSINADAKGTFTEEIGNLIEETWKPLLKILKEEFAELRIARQDLSQLMFKSCPDLIEDIDSKMEALSLQIKQAEASFGTVSTRKGKTQEISSDVETRVRSIWQE